MIVPDTILTWFEVVGLIDCPAGQHKIVIHRFTNDEEAYNMAIWLCSDDDDAKICREWFGVERFNIKVVQKRVAVYDKFNKDEFVEYINK